MTVTYRGGLKRPPAEGRRGRFWLSMVPISPAPDIRVWTPASTEVFVSVGHTTSRRVVPGSEGRTLFRNGGATHTCGVSAFPHPRLRLVLWLYLCLPFWEVRSHISLWFSFAFIWWPTMSNVFFTHCFHLCIFVGNMSLAHFLIRLLLNFFSR